MHLELEPPPRQFAAGFANLNYLIRLDGRLAVLRRPPEGPHPPGAYDMAREYRILSQLWRAFPLAPRGLHLCEDPRVIGEPFQIVEYRDGVSLRDALPAPVAGDPAAGAALGEMLIDVLVALHRVDPAAVGFDTFAKPTGFLRRAVEGWIRRATIAVEGWDRPATLQLIVELAHWLRENQAGEERAVLLHNDFKLDNVLIDAATLAPLAVLDWDQGARGDGLFDLAVLLSYWTEGGDPPAMHRMAQMPTTQPGFPTREQAALRSGARPRSIGLSLPPRPRADAHGGDLPAASHALAPRRDARSAVRGVWRAR